MPPRSRAFVIVLATAQIVVAAVFIGLYFWARRSPLPATITGLVVYATLLVLNIINSVSQMSSDTTQRTGFGGLGIGWLDIVIIIMLVQGIQAALKHKKMIESGAA